MRLFLQFLIMKLIKIILLTKIKIIVIQPIDFSNTGIIRQNSVWNGLHQFLQIKHGLRLTEENLSSCFISNLIFFKLYKKWYGFNGTLGSLKTQEAIKEIYNIELVKIPSFKI